MRQITEHVYQFEGLKSGQVYLIIAQDNDLTLIDTGTWGLQIIHTPGHTPGSIGLYQPERKILFSGDSLCNEGKLTVMQGIYNTDDQELLDAVQKFRNLGIDIICVGHGTSILEKGSDRIEDILGGGSHQ